VILTCFICLFYGCCLIYRQRLMSARIKYSKMRGNIKVLKIAFRQPSSEVMNLEERWSYHR